MWKKIGVTLIAFLSTFSVIYMMNKNLFAESITYNAGGSVTGRVNRAPSNLSLAVGATNIGMQKGDKVLSGVNEPDKIGFQLIYEDKEESGWFTMSTKSLGHLSPFTSIPSGSQWADSAIYSKLGWKTIGPAKIYRDNELENTQYASLLNDFNNRLKTSTIHSIMGNRNINYLTAISNAQSQSPEYIDSFEIMKKSAVNNLAYTGKIAYLPDFQTIFGETGTFSLVVSEKGYKIPSVDLKYTNDYVAYSFQFRYLDGVAQSLSASVSTAGTLAYGGSAGSGMEALDVRPSMMLHTDDIVFAISPGSTNALSKIKEPKLPSSYSSILDETRDDKDMKVRIYDSNLNIVLNGLLDNYDEKPLIMKDGYSELPESATLKFDVTAVSGDVVSAIVFDKHGSFIGYRPLEQIKGAGKYAFNTEGLAIGEYQVGVVSETYDRDGTEPTFSSLISNVYPLKIVQQGPLTISYEATPLSQTTYEYNKNVKSGHKIGIISSNGGVSPIHYEIVADGSDDTFQNFEIADLGVNGDSAGGSLDVKVKASGAPNIMESTNSLQAGKYKFCIISKDAIGSPSIDVIGKNKVCTSLMVNKTTPTVTINTTTQKNLKIGDSVFTDAITTSNTDTLTNSDVTYSLSGGIPGVLTSSINSGDPLKYDLSVVNTYTGNSLPTTFTLQATIKETANYLSGATSVNRPILVYKEISGFTWTANKASYSSSDVTTGKTVGDLLVKDGIGPFDYELTTSSDPNHATDGKDNSLFTIANGRNVASGTKVNVNTSSNLFVGSYKIQFKVIDKGKGTTLYATASITVSAQVQSKVYFTDFTGTNDITGQGITLKVNEMNTSLLANGGSVTSSSIEYYVATQGDQPNQIDPNLYLSVNQASGLLTPIKVGTVRVYATRPGDGSYASANSAFMDVIIEPAQQSIEFDIATNPNKVGKGNSIIEKATGTVTLTNTQGVGGITYSSSDPTIASIDASGNVTGVSAGSVTITATLNAPSSSTYDSNYETQSCQKTITVYNAMSLNWNAKTPNLKAESSVTGDSAGSVSATSNIGNVSYKISTNTGIAANADGGLFSITPNGNVQLKTQITAVDLNAHGSNDYKVRVEATDNNDTTFIDINITIDDATNTPHFMDSNGNVISSISEVYGENANSFQLYSSTSNGIPAVYQLDLRDTSGTISVNGLGQVTINKVGTGSAQLVASSGTGYDGTTLNIPITITPGNQAISFVDTTTSSHVFTAGGTFNEPAILKETSANSVSSRTITYTSSTPRICTIDAIGTISMVTTGNCVVTAENSSTNWQPVTTSKTINLFTGMGVTFAQSNTPQAETASAQVGSPIGNVQVVPGTGFGTKSYVVSTANSPQNKDASFFTINKTSGIVSLAKSVNANDIASSYDSAKQAYVLYVQFETSDALGNKVTTNAEVKIKGAPLNAGFDRVVNGKITQTYSPNGTFTIQLSSNVGNGVPTYQIKNDPAQPNDVLKGISNVSGAGLATIANANDRVANPKPVMVEAIIPPSNGYDSETIEVEVEIIKATQPGFGFTNTAIQMSINSTMTPVIKNKLSTGSISISSSNTSLVSVNGTDVVSNTNEGTTTITVIDAGDRNYKTAMNTATVEVSSAPAYGFIIQVPSATYGDTGVQAIEILNELATEYPGEIGTQTWESSDPLIADVDASGNITIYKAGTVDITCTQTSTGGVPTVRSSAALVISPKPITITINDKSKYVGESVPGFDMTIANGVLELGDTISLPNFSCLDTSNTPVTNTSPAGSYPITGTYPTGANPNYALKVTSGILTVKQDVSLSSWYHLEGVSSGNTLDPTKWYNEDVKVVLDAAIEAAGTYDEISLNQTLWDTTSITLTQEDENREDVYFRIRASGILSTNQNTTIKIDKTNPIVKSITGTQTNKNDSSSLINNLTFGIFFKQGTLVKINSVDLLPSPNAKVSGLQEIAYEVYEIDQKTGIINSTQLDTGTDIPDANGNIEVKLDDVGLYRVCAIAKDNAGNVSGESCSDVNIKKIDVDIDDDGENEFQDPENDGCPDINIALQDEKSVIYKINVDRDGDDIPDLNIDSDGDGIAEINVDANKDGKPDLNLVILTKWEPTFCVKEQIDYEGKPIEYCTMKDIKPVINVDTGNDGIPDIDIDNVGDFKPHLNISNDGRTPYLNITKIHDWKPIHDYTSTNLLYGSIGKNIGEPFPEYNYDSDEDGKADINIDLNNDKTPDINIDKDYDGIPDLDIDGNGDGNPDYNLESNDNGIPTKKIIRIPKWTPDLNGKKDNYEFDTMEIKTKNELEDNGVIVEKPEGGFLPNHAIKVEDIKDTIAKSDKDKLEGLIEEDLEIKDIFDVKLSDGTNNIQPDGSIKVRIPVSEEVANSDTVKVIIEQADGSYKEVIATIKDGYIEYETDYLGKVGIIADKAKAEEPDPDKPDVPIPNFKPIGSGGSTPDASVKGNYTPGIGGAGTGDIVMLLPYGISMSIAIGTLLLINLTRKKHHDV